MFAAPVLAGPAVYAAEAMRDEVLLSPKPGLVDRLDNGAHRDMDLSLFLKSADAIYPFLEEMAALTPSDGPPEAVLPVIRPVGVEAEKAMFRATGGINTHKGQIFTLGVCTAASQRSRPAAREILNEAGRICRGLSEELDAGADLPLQEKSSNGRRAYRKYGSSGIRGEAEAGFPSVRDHSLPAFRAALAKGCRREEAGLEALLILMTVVEDSNVLHRRGIGGLNLMRQNAESFLLSGGMAQREADEKLGRMNSLFISENISPGGCADLLALTFFLAALEDRNGR